jgi:hypothetical protein
VFLDRGSTNLALAREIPLDRPLTIVTNSISIAAALIERKNLRSSIARNCCNAKLDSIPHHALSTQVSRVGASSRQGPVSLPGVIPPPPDLALIENNEGSHNPNERILPGIVINRYASPGETGDNRVRDDIRCQGGRNCATNHGRTRGNLAMPSAFGSAKHRTSTPSQSPLRGRPARGKGA